MAECSKFSSGLIGFYKDRQIHKFIIEDILIKSGLCLIILKWLILRTSVKRSTFVKMDYTIFLSSPRGRIFQVSKVSKWIWGPNIHRYCLSEYYLQPWICWILNTALLAILSLNQTLLQKRKEFFQKQWQSKNFFLSRANFSMPFFLL